MSVDTPCGKHVWSGMTVRERIVQPRWYADMAAAAYDKVGQPDSALARYERFLATGHPYRLYVDASRLGQALRRA